ncbi:MAG: Zn-ribbon domain-containing OB-fold protein [Gemmatimonadota bacterium]|nr:MAG: Zn-ribbon domain-containing OB-fold protein [Gemmatimonadota bacterium]
MVTPARYWREIPQRYRLEAGKCTRCGKTYFPPRLVCACGAREFEIVRLKDEGTLQTFTVIRVAPSQFVDEAPYAIGIVELNDGVRLTAQVVDCDVEHLEIGQKVKVEFRRIQTVGEAGILCYGYKCVPV